MVKCPYCEYQWEPRKEPKEVIACPDCKKRFAPHTSVKNAKPILVRVG